MTLTGTLTIGGQTITAAALRSGAQSAYSNSGTWNSTSSGWNGATAGSTANAVGRFNCKLLYVTGNVIYVNGTGAYWQEKEVRLANGGTSKIKYLGVTTV